jgi:hypothetical protein
MNKGTAAAIGTILMLTGGVMIICLPLGILLEVATMGWLELLVSLAFYAAMTYVGVHLVRKSKYGAGK